MPKPLTAVEIRPDMDQALAFNAFQGGISAGLIVEAKPFTMVVNEVALAGIPVQMRFGDVKKAAIYGTLEQAEITLDRVDVPEIGADIFLGGMVHCAVPSELPPNGPMSRFSRFGTLAAGMPAPPPWHKRGVLVADERQNK